MQNNNNIGSEAHAERHYHTKSQHTNNNTKNTLSTHKHTSECKFYAYLFFAGEIFLQILRERIM